LLNETDVDYRKLNFIRLTILKEQPSLLSIEERDLLRYFKNVLRSQHEQVYSVIRDCCLIDAS